MCGPCTVLSATQGVQAAQQIRLGHDPDQLRALDHGQTANALVHQQVGCLAHGRVRCDGDHGVRHHLLDPDAVEVGFLGFVPISHGRRHHRFEEIAL